VELFWTPASLIQAEDRVHRIGKIHVLVPVFRLVDRICFLNVRTKEICYGILSPVQSNNRRCDMAHDIAVSTFILHWICFFLVSIFLFLFLFFVCLFFGFGFGFASFFLSFFK
jgi:hypothetical protein